MMALSISLSGFTLASSGFTSRTPNSEDERVNFEKCFRMIQKAIPQIKKIDTDRIANTNINTTFPNLIKEIALIKKSDFDFIDSCSSLERPRLVQYLQSYVIVSSSVSQTLSMFDLSILMKKVADRQDEAQAQKKQMPEVDDELIRQVNFVLALVDWVYQFE